MALKVRITQRAKLDIAEIRSYIQQHDKHAAERVRLSIVQAIDLIAEYSSMGPATDEPGVRLKLVSRFPYRIYYRVREDQLEILHIRHTARKGPSPGDLA